MLRCYFCDRASLLHLAILASALAVLATSTSAVVAAAGNTVVEPFGEENDRRRNQDPDYDGLKHFFSGVRYWVLVNNELRILTLYSLHINHYSILVRCL